MVGKMKVEIKETGPCQREISVCIPAEFVGERLAQEYREMGQLVQVPGFRRGRVPRRVLERRYGKEIQAKARTDLMEETLEKIFEEHQIRPVGEIELGEEELGELKAGEDFVFRAMVEVLPEVEPKEYKGVKVVKRVEKVREEDLEKALQEVFARTNPLEEKVGEGVEVEEGDVVVVELELLAEGSSVLRQGEVHLYVGEDRIGSLVVEGLTERLLGKRVGDRVEFEQELGEEFARKDLAGKVGLFVLKVLKISTPKYKEPCDEWARGDDFESLEEFREHLRKEMERANEEEAERRVRDQLLDQIVEKTPFPLPERLVEKSVREQENYERVLMKMRGMSEEEVEKHVEAHRLDWRRKAERDFRIFFLLDKIAQKEKIFVVESEVEQYLERLAAEQNKELSQLKEELIESGRLSKIRAQLREKKTLDWLLEQAVVETVD